MKYLSSYFKRDWDFNDYPVEFRRVQFANEGGEAVNGLRSGFERFRAENPLPRPGAKVPLEYASTRHIDSYGEIASDVLAQILHLDYNQCFLRLPEEPIQKIKALHGVDVSDIRSGNLVDIFERIPTGPKFRSAGSLNRHSELNSGS